MLYVLLALSVVVSVFGMVNTLVLAVHERTRELGMLRAVGMTRRQARRMVRGESVVTALIGAALGLPLGIAMAALVTRAMSEWGVEMSAAGRHAGGLRAGRRGGRRDGRDGPGPARRPARRAAGAAVRVARPAHPASTGGRRHPTAASARVPGGRSPDYGGGMSGMRHRVPAVAAVAAVLVAGLAPAAATGRNFTVAGAGGFALPMATIAPPMGDGGPASLARILYPTAVAALPDGGYLVADGEGNRIRRVSSAGVITTIAGTGRGGLTGDGGPATAARMDWPTGVAPLTDGSVAIADQRNNRVRLIDPAGTIRTLAQVTSPDGVAPAADGGVLVVQDFENRVLHVDRAGVVTAAAGTGARGFAGDGGPATAALLNRPVGVAAASDGGFLIADGSSHVRRVAAGRSPRPPPCRGPPR